jgi:hypothetical protein
MLEGTYLLKFEDDTGNRSAVAALIVSDFPEPQPRSLFKQYTEDQDAPPFNGARAGMVYSATYDGLILESSDPTTYVVPDYWGTTYAEELSSVNPVGEYEFEDTWDMGAVYDVNLRRRFITRPLVLSALWDSKSTLIDSWLTIDDLGSDRVNAQMYVRATPDNPSSSPVWGEWNELSNAIARGRGFQFKVRAISDDPDINIIIDELGCLMELQLHTEQSAIIASGAASYAATFDNAFYQAPNIGITAQNMATGDFFTVSAVTRTGFSVVFKNSAGTNVNRNFTYTAVGYGREV